MMTKSRLPRADERSDGAEPSYEDVVRTMPVTALKGMFGPALRRVSIEEMNAEIARRGAAAMDIER